MLLDDTEIKGLFNSLRQIASFLEDNGMKESAAAPLQGDFSSAAHLFTLLSSSHGSTESLNYAIRSQIDSRHPEISEKVNTSDIATLSDIGHLLRLITSQLEKRVDACLIEFYEHMKKKEYLKFNAKSPRCQHEPNSCRRLDSSRSNAGSAKNDRDRVLDDGAEGDLILEGSESSLKGFLCEGCSRRDVPIHKRAAKGRTESSHSMNLCSFPPTTTKKERHRVPSSSRRPHEVVPIFQNHLYLLLESALAQTSASCGAIYLSDTKEANTTEDGPRFLLRVADIRGENRLPKSVSFATMNTLTTVALTGVGVNLSGAKPAAAVYRARGQAGKGAMRAAAPKPMKEIVSRFLQVETAVVMPIDTIGCVILANKRGMGADDARFLRADEFVVWGVAKFCKQIFTHYKTDLFLQHPWAPSAMICLRPFAVLPSVGESSKDSQLPKMPFSSGRWKSFARIFKECNKNIEKDRVPKPLVVVREDMDAIDRLDYNEVVRLRDVADSCAVMNEEVIFASASQYITNIETLWTQAIEENIRLKANLEKVVHELEEQRQKLFTTRQRRQRFNSEKSQVTNL